MGWGQPCSAVTVTWPPGFTYMGVRVAVSAGPGCAVVVLCVSTASGPTDAATMTAAPSSCFNIGPFTTPPGG